MTALASSLLAALPGGLAPFAGAGAAASAGVGGAFEELLAGLLAGETDAAQADAGQTTPDALLQPDGAVTVFAVAPAPLPLPAPVASATAESGAMFKPADRAGIETGLPDLTAPLVMPAAEVSNAVVGLAAQVWTRPNAPTAVAAAAPADVPPAVTDQAQVETAALPAATMPEIPGKAMPARTDPSIRAGLARQMDSQPAAAPSTVAQPAAPAIPPARTEAVIADALPLAAPVRAVAPEGESRRPAIAARGERPTQAAARSGLTPTAASDRPAPVEIAAADLAAFDGDESQAIDLDAAPAELAEAPETRSPALSAESRAATVGTTAAVAAEALVRGSPETVAKLAADIVRKLDGQTTRFDLELDPHGLGKVDVAIEIDRAGKMTAALTFDSAQSAADLRGRSGELRLALERAGFDISEGGLTFDLADQGPGFGGREAAQQERGWNGRAFQRAQSGAEEADAALTATTQPPSRTRSGIDIRI